MNDPELAWVPGFINELTGYTLSQAHSPNRTLADTLGNTRRICDQLAISVA